VFTSKCSGVDSEDLRIQDEGFGIWLVKLAGALMMLLAL